MVVFFITEYVDSNAVLSLNFVIMFLRYRKFNVFIIQPSNILFVIFLNSLRIFSLWVQMSNVTPSKAFVIFVLYVDQSFCWILKFYW